MLSAPCVFSEKNLTYRQAFVVQYKMQLAEWIVVWLLNTMICKIHLIKLFIWKSIPFWWFSKACRTFLKHWTWTNSNVSIELEHAISGLRRSEHQTYIIENITRFTDLLIEQTWTSKRCLKLLVMGLEHLIYGFELLNVVLTGWDSNKFDRHFAKMRFLSSRLIPELARSFWSLRKR